MYVPILAAAAIALRGAASEETPMIFVERGLQSHVALHIKLGLGLVPLENMSSRLVGAVEARRQIEGLLPFAEHFC